MDNDLAAEALATIEKLQRKIERMEKAAAKREREQGRAGASWDEPAMGGNLFKESDPHTQIGRPGRDATMDRVHVGEEPPEPIGKGRGDDEVGPLGLTRKQIRDIDAAEAADRKRVAKGSKAVPSITDGLLKGKRLRGS